jgi:hypothetical protein
MTLDEFKDSYLASEREAADKLLITLTEEIVRLRQHVTQLQAENDRLRRRIGAGAYISSADEGIES